MSGGEIEEVDLQVGVLSGHRRAAAESGDAAQPAGLAAMLHPGVAPGRDRIDTDRRPQVLAEADVGGGKAEGAAAAVALLDPPLDLPGAAEQLGGLGRTPLA